MKKFAENKKIYDNEIILEAEAGNVLIFDGNLWHGGGACTVEKSRWALILGYARWFIRPSFDFMKNTPKKIYKNLNLSQKKLLGYNLNSPKDEFTRTRRISPSPEIPTSYRLPVKK